MVVLAVNFIYRPLARGGFLLRPWSIYFYSSMEKLDFVSALPSIYLRICQTSGCRCVSYRTWNPRLSRRPFELSGDAASTCPGGESISAGIANFLGFSNRYPSFLTLIIDDGVRTWPDTFENVDLSFGRITRRDRFLWKSDFFFFR